MLPVVHREIDEKKALIQDSLQDLKTHPECEGQKREATGNAMVVSPNTIYHVMGHLLLVVQLEQSHHDHICRRGTECYPAMKMNART